MSSTNPAINATAVDGSFSAIIRLFLVAATFALLTPFSASAAVGFGDISAVDNAISRTSIAVSGADTVGIVFVAGDTGSDSITSVTCGDLGHT